MVVKPLSYADKGKAPVSQRGPDDDVEGTSGSRKRPRNSIHIDSSECLPNDVKQEELDAELKAINNAANRMSTLLVPKEEQIDEKEFERIIEERFHRHFGRLSGEEAPSSIGECSNTPSKSDAKIWKVKCAVGHERKLVFCLMQKYVYFTYIKEDLQIICAFTVDRVKGFIFVEADKGCYVYEACKSLDGLYASKLEELSTKEVSSVLSTTRQEPNSITEGMSVRATNGIYKGDIGEVWSVNEKRKHAVVKLVPRIDLKQLAKKFGGEKTPLKLRTPARKLLSSSELSEFGSNVKEHVNKSTGERFQVIDGLMLKDGYLFKKISLDSLSAVNSSPPDDDLCKTKSSDKRNLAKKVWTSEDFPISIDDDQSDEPEWPPESKFELGELVFWGRNMYGLVISIEVGNTYKILKDEEEGNIVIAADESLLKHGPSCAKYSAFDKLKKGVFIDDRVRVSEGCLKDREGVVRKIYKGTLFIIDEHESENGGYFCCKAQLCEKLNKYDDDFSPSSSRGQSDSTKPPNRSRENLGTKFFVGQRLRIRVGAFKGHLCSFVRKHQSDVTVRLDTKQKTVEVKLEHLCEVHERKSSLPTTEVEHRNSESNVGAWNTEAKQLNTNSTSWDAPASNKDSETGRNEENQVGRNSSWNDESSKKNDDGWSAQANPSWEAPCSTLNNSETGWNTSSQVDQNTRWNDGSTNKKDNEWSAQANSLKSGETGWNAQANSLKSGETGWNAASQADHNASWNEESSKNVDNRWGSQATSSSWTNSENGGGCKNVKDDESQACQNSSWDAPVESNDQTNGWGKAPNADDSTEQSGSKGWGNVEEVGGTSSKIGASVSAWDALSSAPDNEGGSSWRSDNDGESKKEASSWGSGAAIDNDNSGGWGRRQESVQNASENGSSYRGRGRRGEWTNRGRGRSDWNRGSFRRYFGDNHPSWGRARTTTNYNGGESSTWTNRSKPRAKGEPSFVHTSETQSTWNTTAGNSDTVNATNWGKQETESTSRWGQRETSEKGEGDSVRDPPANAYGG